VNGTPAGLPDGIVSVIADSQTETQRRREGVPTPSLRLCVSA